MSDFDFWEFVCCIRCHQPVVSDTGGPTVPFWLTECGHVVCNNHLKSDQSCIECGAQKIQVTPLQQDMEQPMSDWFRNTTSSLDSITYSVKFQQDILASQIRYYKAKYQRQRLLSDQLKKANEALAYENSELRHNHPSRQYANGQFEGGPAQYVNSNGKRPMATQRHPERPVSAASSSAHSGRPASGGPERLTLPSSQHPPPLRLDHQGSSTNRHSAQPTHSVPPSQRLGTSNFQERYGYSEPPRQSRSQHPVVRPQKQSNYSMLPPPVPEQTLSNVPAPLAVHKERSLSASLQGIPAGPPPSANRFVQHDSSFRPPTQQSDKRCMVPPTPSRGHQFPLATAQVEFIPPETTQRKRFIPRGQGQSTSFR